MKKKVDFYIVYEHWQRELFGALLLENELKRRGHSVIISSLATNPECDFMRKKVAPQIVLYPWIYDDKNLSEALSFGRTPNKVINMQSEQILNELTLNRHYKQSQRDGVYNVCWGETTVKRFMSAGVEKRNLKICGNINFDINHKKYNSFFPAREHYAEKHDLDLSKKWVMFFSDFIYFPEISGFARSRIKNDKTGKYEQLADIQKRTRAITLRMFMDFLTQHDDYIIIYRPKPTEVFNNDDIYREIVATCDNFKYIPDGTIQEWIHVCDFFLTCDSTSFIDVKMQSKRCAIIRPFDIPEWYKSDIFKEAVPIKCKDDLERFLCEQAEFPYAKQEVLNQMIGVGLNGEYAFLKLADWLENLLLDREHSIRRAFSQIIRIKKFVQKFIESKGRYLMYKVLGPLYIKGEITLSGAMIQRLGINTTYECHEDEVRREIEWRKKIEAIEKKQA